VTKISDNQIV